MGPAGSHRISRVPRYSGFHWAAGRSRLLGFHRLWRNFPVASTSVRFAVSWSYNPAHAETSAVWALPRSLATTCGIIFIFFSCGYLDVSVPRVCFTLSVMTVACRVAPFGYLRIYGYLLLPAAFRSLSRPSSPPRA